MTLELDHVFCMVDDLEPACSRLAGEGWPLDAGTVHSGEGTSNRRLVWPEHHLELLSVYDWKAAVASPLGLALRARWRTTGASPFGVGLRGQLPEADREDYWLHEERGARIWMHRDNERAPERPLVFIVEAVGEQMEARRPRTSHAGLLRDWDGPELRELRLFGPTPCRLPPHAGPPIVQAAAAHRLELVAGDGELLEITPILRISRLR